ncbi:MAG TPA: hypothetical protein VH969_20470 [Actinophytocola sp.]|jgi:hypothetical protein|uniref:hypothetical protein n=1 Tax=Actinophytocola sp. TaxID=1872138 RepID=UPI002F91D23B
MSDDADFDFTAADRLSQQLSQLAAKLDWLVWLRGSQRSGKLGSPGSDNWTGSKRHQFEGEFRREQNALTSLADRARTARGNVADQISAAHAAQRKSD